VTKGNTSIEVGLTDEDVNWLRRTSTLIRESAQQATEGPWSLDHGHVVKRKFVALPGGGKKDASHDVAAPPFGSGYFVRGSNPNGWKDMRHIAVCDPKTMLKLIDLVGRLLEERKS
jgi:hypothetical protein